LFGGLSALGLRLAEDRGQLGVALAFGVLDVGLQPQALFGQASVNQILL
jgi:hypothetical protein